MSKGSKLDALLAQEGGVQRFNFTLKKETHDRFNAVCKALGRKMSPVVEALIEDFVARQVTQPQPELPVEVTAALLKSLDAALSRLDALVPLASGELVMEATNQEAVKEVRQQVATLRAIVAKRTGTDDRGSSS
jgi:hypothetical protein